MRPLGHAPDQQVEPCTDLGLPDPHQSGSSQGFGTFSHQLDGLQAIPAPTGGHGANSRAVRPCTESNLLLSLSPINGLLGGDWRRPVWGLSGAPWPFRPDADIGSRFDLSSAVPRESGGA